MDKMLGHLRGNWSILTSQPCAEARPGAYTTGCRTPWGCGTNARLPGEGPGELHGQSMGSQGVRHDSVTLTFFLSVSDLGQMTGWGLFYH